MSAVSEVVYTLRCDYPDCHVEVGPDPSLGTLRADAHTEDGWVTNGADDYCAQHVHADG